MYKLRKYKKQTFKTLLYGYPVDYSSVFFFVFFFLLETKKNKKRTRKEKKKDEKKNKLKTPQGPEKKPKNRNKYCLTYY